MLIEAGYVPHHNNLSLIHDTFLYRHLQTINTEQLARNSISLIRHTSILRANSSPFRCSVGKPKIVEYLVDRGADVNAIDLNTNDNILHLLLKTRVWKELFRAHVPVPQIKAPSLLDGRTSTMKVSNVHLIN
ncbi:hypothetical protein BCR33DRAFT_565182 [Rhizoclosmatium globosum]|uniref:Ankyrin n=1 Tax=Rhizoclosmatium globosum TaxID=329046 RepID=A0A1Y2B7Q0_9FUNG|nr:hypothetical protein BCR33DRAFT_565182 [Rhizoclosmatium globosum]|eukprot:ORY30716.1 hypothetical protein BCR33DRAFT_565182 [Rhizoclosmatium globosum]